MHPGFAVAPRAPRRCNGACALQAPLRALAGHGAACCAAPAGPPNNRLGAGSEIDNLPALRSGGPARFCPKSAAVELQPEQPDERLRVARRRDRALEVMKRPADDLDALVLVGL